MTEQNNLCLLSVQTGQAQFAMVGGRRVATAYAKTPTSERLAVHALGLDGDEQVNTTYHGGLDKAVYAYPSEHYAYWIAQRNSFQVEGFSLPYGAMGENLTLRGLTEDHVFVGDELHFPDCVLRITEPRQPCATFCAMMGDKLAAKKMQQTGFSGFYLRVLKTGSLAAGETFTLVQGPRQRSILDCFQGGINKRNALL